MVYIYWLLTKQHNFGLGQVESIYRQQIIYDSNKYFCFDQVQNIQRKE